MSTSRRCVAIRSSATTAGQDVVEPRRRPTIGDVAKAAGVSPSTASRALTGQGYAAADVKAKVLAAGIEQVLGAAGYQTVLVNDDGDTGCELAGVRTLLTMRVPGTIVTPLSAEAGAC